MMSEISMLENFDHNSMDNRLHWFCEPARWHLENSKLVIEPEAKTDFWQRTHYGFSADNGPILGLDLNGDFVMSTRVRFFPAHQYDQAGLAVRLSPDCWLKTSVEYEPHELARLGAVVTNGGYSDWSTQSYDAAANELELRIRRVRDDFTIEYRQANGDKAWNQMRVAHLHLAGAAVFAGVYACSPIDAGYKAEFEYLRIE